MLFFYEKKNPTYFCIIAYLLDFLISVTGVKRWQELSEAGVRQHQLGGVCRVGLHDQKIPS